MAEKKIKPQEKPHYVNNKEFSLAVVDYCESAEKARKQKSKNIPIVPDYIAECFLKIAEGLSHKSNFIRYTYREEMVMDAVENCLKAIKNYDIKTATRTGTPNAFAYFTQISWYAFLRRIEKEKRQQDSFLRRATDTMKSFLNDKYLNLFIPWFNSAYHLAQKSKPIAKIVNVLEQRAALRQKILEQLQRIVGEKFNVIDDNQAANVFKAAVFARAAQIQINQASEFRR